MLLERASLLLLVLLVAHNIKEGNLQPAGEQSPFAAETQQPPPVMHFPHKHKQDSGRAAVSSPPPAWTVPPATTVPNPAEKIRSRYASSSATPKLDACPEEGCVRVSTSSIQSAGMQTKESSPMCQTVQVSLEDPT